MKYIVIQHTIGGITQKLPFLFPDILVHSLVASAMVKILKDKHKFSDVKVVSAGDAYCVEASCSGSSSTLKLKSLPGDSGLIEMFDLLHGFEAPENEDQDKQVEELLVVLQDGANKVKELIGTLELLEANTKTVCAHEKCPCPEMCDKKCLCPLTADNAHLRGQQIIVR